MNAWLLALVLFGPAQGRLSEQPVPSREGSLSLAYISRLVGSSGGG